MKKNGVGECPVHLSGIYSKRLSDISITSIRLFNLIALQLYLNHNQKFESAKLNNQKLIWFDCATTVWCPRSISFGEQKSFVLNDLYWNIMSRIPLQHMHNINQAVSYYNSNFTVQCGEIPRRPYVCLAGNFHYICQIWQQVAIGIFTGFVTNTLWKKWCVPLFSVFLSILNDCRSPLPCTVLA